MTDPTTGSKLVTINTPAGERQLKRLSAADWVSLGNTLTISRKQELRIALASGAVDPDEARRRLDEFDKRPVRYRDVEVFANTMQGQYAALRLAVQKDMPRADDAAVEAAVDALGLHPQDWLRVVAELLSLNVVSEGPADPPAGGVAVDPPAPPTTDPTGTTSPTA